MKKRVMLMLCAVGMAFSLSACQGEAGTTDVATSENVGEVKDKEEQEKVEEEQETEDEFFDRVYTERWFGYSIGTPSGFHQGDEGWGYEVYGGDFCIHITQYCGDMGHDVEKERIDMSQYEDSTDIFELLLPNVAKEQFGSVEEIVDYEVEVLFTKEINGVEMTKFQGEIVHQVLDDATVTYPVVAYGIKGAKTPILIFAYDMDPEKRLFNEWVDRIDEMVTTFVDAK